MCVSDVVIMSYVYAYMMINDVQVLLMKYL